MVMIYMIMVYMVIVHRKPFWRLTSFEEAGGKKSTERRAQTDAFFFLSFRTLRFPG
jgi:hypothetical protein